MNEPMHLLRLLCFGCLVTGLHLLADQTRSSRDNGPGLTLAQLQEFVPRAASMTSSGDPPVWEIRDQDQETIALACLTSPQADGIVGYAGPNNLLLLMDPSGHVTAVHWIQSVDTIDHVERVRSSDGFWDQFKNRTLGEPSSGRVDGVSGATLTSLAVAEAIELRLSGKRPSLRFPQSLTLDEIQGFWPDAHRIEDDQTQIGRTRVFDANNQTLGWVLRTGSLVDNQIGYQGPTELLLLLDQEDRVTKIRLRSSFDNEPYVRYTRMEAAFWSKFVGRTLSEISSVDLAAEGIEGVSGATMTSMAAAETVRLAAARHLAELSSAAQPTKIVRKWNWSIGELATACLALLAVPWSLSRLRGNRRLRLVWQTAVIVVMVGISGNLISLALLAGWTRSMPAVFLAPGLTLLVGIAVLMPSLFGRNVYCDHLCPHGFLQQWMLGLHRRRRSNDTGPNGPLVQISPSSAPPKKPWWKTSWHPALKLSAICVWFLSMGWIIWTVPEQLTIFEPFDVYAWRIGWSVSLGVWLASLLLAIKEPMGYCRLACPTGALLESLRHKRTSRRWQRIDMLLLAITLAVWCLYAVGETT